MGCFAVLKYKKKKSEHFISKSSIDTNETTATTLPEPETPGRCLKSAPPSFRTRSKSVHSNFGSTNSRARVLSAPLSLIISDHDTLTSLEYDGQEEFKVQDGSMRHQRLSNALPLPLPSPQRNSSFKSMGSFKMSNSDSPVSRSGPLPLPPLGGALRNFSFEEISSACQGFSVDRYMSDGMSSMFYKATFGDDTPGTKKLEATVSRLLPSSQGLKDFVTEVTTISSIQHPQLCKLLGFHAREGSDQRMLVYERLFHGSLDRLLHGRSEGPCIDWTMRMKVALCAARGLAFLHEEGPFQAMYSEFSTINVQIDKDFSAKLSGYGCATYNPDIEISNTSTSSTNLSIETLEKGLITPKSNVWSFGILLLELLTGRKNNDARYPKEEQNIVKWSRPFLADDCRLSLIMDPRMKGRFPPKAARAVTDISLKCLQKDPSERPTMRTIVEALVNVQDMKFPSRYPLQDPSAITEKQMLKYPSFNNIIMPTPRLYSSSPPLLRIQQQASQRTSVSIPLPPQTCASTISIEEKRTRAVGTLPFPIPKLRRPGVEGF